MRTTLSIDDRLLELAKGRAKSEGVTVGRVVEEALRRLFTTPEPSQSISLPVLRGGRGFQPGFDPSSNVSIADRMDQYDREAGAEIR